MNKCLPSMGDSLRVIIIGASGGIGQALIKELASAPQIDHIFALSRQEQDFSVPKITSKIFDFTNEDNIRNVASNLQQTGKFDLIILATGFLHDKGVVPEKSMRSMSLKNFQANFSANTFGPALTAKYFLPLMAKDKKTVFATLSARVGSISDNHLGGWYAYRASKAALNMITKTLAIEYARRSKDCIIIGLHPGTVDTALSKPFQGNVPENKLFSPEESAQKLLYVIDQVMPTDSGYCLDWAGKTIPF